MEIKRNQVYELNKKEYVVVSNDELIREQDVINVFIHGQITTFNKDIFNKDAIYKRDLSDDQIKELDEYLDKSLRNFKIEYCNLP
jgi:hypothetical protein